jgi:hypothetical protein
MSVARYVLLVAFGFLAGLACSDRHLEDDEDEEAERLCRALCDLAQACERGAPDYVRQCPGANEECFHSCLEAGPLNWNEPCRELRIQYMECMIDLDCDELYEQNPCSEVQWDEQPCADENWDYSYCVGTH